jgi:phosphatidylserine/phosphatidylglycerophosphate/cardiolipin synthase-like enzyme
MSLSQYLAHPEDVALVVSARRSNPVATNASWDDKIEVQTADGRHTLPLDLFVQALKQFRLRGVDVVVSVPDATEAPGVKRMGKMLERTQRWLTRLLDSNVPRSADLSNI